MSAMSLVETSSPERLLVNKRELAKRILRTSLPTLDDLMGKYPDFPIERQGSNGVEYLFDADRVVEFLRQKREDEARAAQQRQSLFEQFSLPIDDVAPDEARALTPAQRAALARARLAERKLAIESGLLVSSAEMRQVLTMALGRLGKFLEQLPGQVARDHRLPEEVARAMRSRMDDARRVFVRDLKALLEESEEPEARDGTRG